MTTSVLDTSMLGAEALPSGFDEIQRTLRTFLMANAAGSESRGAEPAGLLAIAGRWMDESN